MKKPRRKGPPSRLRYEKKKPTISCRVPKEIYDRLTAAKKSEKSSFADILKIGLGTIEIQRQDEAAVRKTAYADGFKNGYAKAERLYKVTYPCSVCGQTIELSSDGERQAASAYMRERQWRHGECANRGR
ncbi:MAG: hypothetical protein Q7O66_10890 [Dehalococcoidia bacterium]|nr:hypothetical protein [Dehalococcoidia bacterium]